jgi:mitogen-activated protein kinase 1/3
MSKAANVSIHELQQHMSQFDGGRYKLESVIGAGSYGIVLQGLDTHTGKPCAIKRVSPEIFKDTLLARRILREIKLLSHFDHENIIGLQNILRPHNEDFDVIYIVMDVMETDLKAILKSGQQITEQHVQFFIYQILRGLDCIHKADVIHRDLTPSNILLDTNCDLKICDFGLAKEATGDELELTDYVVMRWYRAPELVMEHKHYGPPVDVWACGCILGEMFHKNKAVFPGKDRINQLDVILEIIGTPTDEDISKIGSQAAQRYLKRRPKYKGVDFATFFQTPERKLLSEHAADLLRRMLTFNPEKRISVHEALNHPYLADLHDPEDEALCRPNVFKFSEDGLRDVPSVKKEIYHTIVDIQQRNAAKEQRVAQVLPTAEAEPAARPAAAASATGHREGEPKSPHIKRTDPQSRTSRTALQGEREGEMVAVGDQEGGEWKNEIV